MTIGIVGWHARTLIGYAAAASPHPWSTSAPDRLADLLKLAENNDPIAEYELARMYGNGYGVPKSLQDEQKWLERAAAEHGNVQAQYEYGRGAARRATAPCRTTRQARKWMQLAAEGGNGPAQLALGMMYRTGLGHPDRQRQGLRLAQRRRRAGRAGRRRERATTCCRASPPPNCRKRRRRPAA